MALTALRPEKVLLLECDVLDSREKAPGCRLLRLDLPEMAPRIEAGQFLHIRPAGVLTPYLRRPFSVYDVPASPRGAVDLLFTVIGSGTYALGSLRPGTRASVLGPLGRPFRFASDGAVSVLVAGGIGVAPFPDLAKKLIAAGSVPAKDIRAVLGARSRSLVFCREDFAALGVPCEVGTDDGSEGFHGNAVQLTARVLEGLRGQPVRIYGCGPEPMLRALQKLCVERKISGQLSIDRRMACGLGICRSCVVRVKDPAGPDWHFETVCREGPVFDTETLLW
ncbi:MAG: dihydroorotate dehydrogenase electron transfer subunit [Planctomycetales bacterium]|nr:dihydroorotate dehydrogenase electron transfer subunit [Planctomycetales bacterium]